MFDGDSITYGSGLTIPPDKTYPTQVADLMGGGFSSVNMGAPAQTLLWMQQNGRSRIDSLFNNSTGENVVVIFAGTNDYVLGSDNTAVYGLTKDYCQERKAAGWRVVVVGMLPRSNQPASFETYRQAIRTQMLADFAVSAGINIWKGGPAAYADYFIDLGGDATIGQAGQSSNTTYYLDGTHLTNAGCAIVAGYVKNAISLFNYP